jgi:hypothetical protein
VPRMNAFRAIYPGPQRQANAQALPRTERGAMSYSEKANGTVAEHEAMQSTVINRLARGHSFGVRQGDELNEHNVIFALNQYQGTSADPKSNFQRFLNGLANDTGAQNAMEADQNLRRTGKATTDATSFIVHRDGSPPTDDEIMRLHNVEHAEPYKIGDVYLFKEKKPTPARTR